MEHQGLWRFMREVPPLGRSEPPVVLPRPLSRRSSPRLCSGPCPSGHLAPMTSRRQVLVIAGHRASPEISRGWVCTNR